MEKIDSVNKKKNTCLVLRSKNKSGKLARIKILEVGLMKWLQGSNRRIGLRIVTLYIYIYKRV